MDTNELTNAAKKLNDRSNEPVSMENLPLAIGCILDDVAEIKSVVAFLSQHLGIGAAGTKPVTIQEAAEYLSTTERAVKKWLKNGQSLITNVMAKSTSSRRNC